MRGLRLTAHSLKHHRSEPRVLPTGIAFSRDVTLSLDRNDADIPLNVYGCAEIP